VLGVLVLFSAGFCQQRHDRRHVGGAGRLDDARKRVRHSHGFHITQPARERGFPSSGRAEVGLAQLPSGLDPSERRLMPARSARTTSSTPSSTPTTIGSAGWKASAPS